MANFIPSTTTNLTLTFNNHLNSLTTQVTTWICNKCNKIFDNKFFTMAGVCTVVVCAKVVMPCDISNGFASQVKNTIKSLNDNLDLQTCQPLRILRNHYAFRVSNTPLRKPVQNVGKLRILRNFGAIRPIPRNLQQLSRLSVSRKSPAGQNIDKDLFILRLPSASASDFAIRSTKEAAEVKPCPMKRRADRE